ncbi:MAG: hypothetical protein UV54_C0030G0001 [Candidatus Beckwithbacteria bacterium GW2011_GWA2_43_10]|uniref:Uncharacterized protein n=1 Tax=Candidatus Beckwithbacteria bacterium GW2011_GWA2_43_10 TaxID=1618369 RepID=A0A0G1C1Z7_9BACT|nr:MAG: hypothetical protein UV54_C0030G0001 [Candidatus Beckwithbacteria bacterium GW2011_GWA2_43_10]
MKIILDDFLNAERLGEVSKNNPVYAIIKAVEFKEADELPFPTDKGKHELTLELDGDELKWLANKTSLKALRAKFGVESDSWSGKKIKLWTIEMNIQGKLKSVVYADGE